MADWLGHVDVIRPAGDVVPDCLGRNPEGVINRGGEVFGGLRIGRGVGAVSIRRADHVSPFDATAGKQDRLTWAPVVAAGSLINLRCNVRDPRRATEFP